MTSKGDLCFLGEYTKKMEEFEERLKALEAKGSSQEEIKSLEDERVEYLLVASPFVNRYYHGEEEVAEQPQVANRGLHAFIETQTVEKRGKIYEDYMRVVEDKIIDPKRISCANNEYYCMDCNVPYVICQTESILSCPQCGKSRQFMDTENGKLLTYNEETSSTVVVNFAYKRINHLIEHLACFQGRETTNIPNEVLDMLRSEFKMNRIKDSQEISQKLVRETLRKLKLNKYYEHSVMITFLLNGLPPPTIDYETEERLKSMFRDISYSFERNKPKGRSNFLSYSYCIRKMCELIERDDLAVCFPFLKSREKLENQDKMWKKICEDLRFEFIPSSNV